MAGGLALSNPRFGTESVRNVRVPSSDGYTGRVRFLPDEYREIVTTAGDLGHRTATAYAAGRGGNPAPRAGSVGQLDRPDVGEHVPGSWVVGMGPAA
jgi:hypothetical protein